MILAEQSRDVVTFNSGKTTEFKIVASAHAFGTLSNNYINKEQAVIREVSCNAVDAHVAAGITEPIEVHLPTSMERWFSVRDYGKGLSEHQMREVFTTYFHSTKTDSNDYIGGLGLGAKSPFCLDGVESFAVVSIHEGTRSTYNCFIGENGCPQISLLSSCPTDERSGIEVMINTGYNSYAFEREAIRVFKFFSFPVNLNIQRVGDEIAKFKDSFIFENEDFVLVKSEFPQFFALMGGVAYSIQTSELTKHYPKSSCYHLSGFMKFDIGDLSFDIGRENLLMDNKTKAAIQGKFLKTVEGIRNYVTEQVESQPTLHKKCLALHKLSKNQMFASFTNDIKSSYEMPTPDSGFTKIKKSKKGSGKCVLSDSTEFSIPLEDDNDSVCYVIKNNSSMNKIKDFFRNSDYKTCVVLTPEQAEESMIDDEFLIDSTTIKQKQVVKQLKFDCYEVDYNYSMYSPLLHKRTIDDFNEERIYVKVKNRNIYTSDMSQYGIMFACKTFMNGKPLYALTEKFCKSKMFAKCKWVNLEDYLKDILSTDLAREYHNLSECDSEAIEFFVEHFSGPGEDFEEVSKAHSEYLKNSYAYYNLLQSGLKPKVKSYGLREMFNEVIDKYPMLGMIDVQTANNTKSIETIRKYLNDNKD